MSKITVQYFHAAAVFLLICSYLLRSDWGLTIKELMRWVWAFEALCTTIRYADLEAVQECATTWATWLIRQSFAHLWRYLFQVFMAVRLLCWAKTRPFEAGHWFARSSSITTTWRATSCGANCKRLSCGPSLTTSTRSNACLWAFQVTAVHLLPNAISE